jgi:hypothetical protein
MSFVREVVNEFYGLSDKLEGSVHDMPQADLERLVTLTLTRLRGHLEHKLGGPHAIPLYCVDDILMMLEEVL